MRDKTQNMMSAVFATVKLLKYVKFALVPISLLGSLVSYGLALGWTFGIILISVLFVHEMGHVIAARRVGVSVSAPYFIPFMGAVIIADQADLKGEKHSIMAAGGPFFGTALAIACLIVYWATGSQYEHILAAAAVGAVLNLFNMMPVRPLDGGRFFDTALPRFGGAIACLLVVLGIVFTDFVLCFIATIMIVENITNPWRKRLVIVATIGTVGTAVVSLTWWIALIVVPLYTFFSYIMYWRQTDYEKEHGREEPRKVSRKWLAIWTVMTIILVVLTALTISAMPQS